MILSDLPRHRIPSQAICLPDPVLGTQRRFDLAMQATRWEIWFRGPLYRLHASDGVVERERCLAFETAGETVN